MFTIFDSHDAQLQKIKKSQTHYSWFSIKCSRLANQKGLGFLAKSYNSCIHPRCKTSKDEKIKLIIVRFQLNAVDWYIKKGLDFWQSPTIHTCFQKYFWWHYIYWLAEFLKNLSKVCYFPKKIAKCIWIINLFGDDLDLVKILIFKYVFSNQIKSM